MARIGMIGLGWLAVACIASAQSGPCQEDGEAECYSTLDIDPYSGSLTGVSTTEIPYWYLSYGIEAYAEGILANLGGGILADVEAYDDGSGYAEADTSGTATDTGQYYEEGDHWEVEFLDGYQRLEIGTTQADQYWTQPCTYPDYEVDSFVGWGGSTGDPNYCIIPGNGSGLRRDFLRRPDGTGTGDGGKPYINVCRASPGEGNLCEEQ